MLRPSILGAAMLAIVALGLSRPSEAAPLPRYGQFIYSSLCADPQGGDVGGYRIRLSRTAKGDSLQFEWSEGGLYGPVRAGKLVIDAKTSEIKFTIPAAGFPADKPHLQTFSGNISSQSVALDGHGVVPRVPTVLAKIEPCKQA